MNDRKDSQEDQVPLDIEVVQERVGYLCRCLCLINGCLQNFDVRSCCVHVDSTFIDG